MGTHLLTPNLQAQIGSLFIRALLRAYRPLGTQVDLLPDAKMASANFFIFNLENILPRFTANAFFDLLFTTLQSFFFQRRFKFYINVKIILIYVHTECPKMRRPIK